MPACRSCSAPIMWAQTVNGKAIPLDAQPSLAGNIELRGNIAHYVTPDANVLGTRYVSQFATCPNSNAHRKKKRTPAHERSLREHVAREGRRRG